MGGRINKSRRLWSKRRGIEMPECNKHANGEIKVIFQGPDCPLCIAYETEMEMDAKIRELEDALRAIRDRLRHIH